MKFVDKLLSFLKGGFEAIINALMAFMEFLAKPLSYVLEFFMGVFYFIFKLFEVAAEVIMIFVAIFQFVFALIAGVLRTIKMWLTFNPDAGDVSFPSVTYKGFEVVTDLLEPTGLMTVVPMVALALLWFFFVIKMLGLFGGQIMVTPYKW